jgi:hypothetical protein
MLLVSKAKNDITKNGAKFPNNFFSHCLVYFYLFVSVKFIILHFSNVALHAVQKALDTLVNVHWVFVRLHQNSKALAALSPGDAHGHDISKLLL